MENIQNEIRLAKSALDRECSLLTATASDLGVLASIHEYGSLSTGHFRGWAPNRVGDTRPLGTLELDVLCRIPTDQISLFAEACVASLGYELIQVGSLTRWARKFSSQVLSKIVPAADGRSILMELLLIDCSYLPITNYWEAVFTPAEINWQARVRACLSDFADDILYFETKCLQVRECRWRTIAAYAAHRLPELTESPYVPNFARAAIPEILQPLVSAWLHGEMDSKDLIRPFTNLVPGAKKIILENLPELVNVPPAVEIYNSALDSQLHIVQNRLKLEGEAFPAS